MFPTVIHGCRPLSSFNTMSQPESTHLRERVHSWDHPRRVHLMVARTLVVALFGQIGLGVVALPIHQVFGVFIGVLGLLLAVCAVRGGFSRSTQALSVALLALLGAQGLLIALSDSVTWFSGLHLINGFVLFGIAIVVAIESEDEGRLPG